MDVQKIIERFALISGLSPEEVSMVTYICSEAKDEITSKLLPGVNVDFYSERLNAAAAALSLYKYLQYKSAKESTESFSAGDISIKENSRKAMDTAYEIWMAEKAKLADILRDDDFVFWQVR